MATGNVIAGINQMGASLSDYNDAQTGFYRMGTSAANRPATKGINLISIRNENGTVCTQIAMSNDAVYYRALASGEWTAWKTITMT